MIHYSHCPVCKSISIKNIFSAKDHTVSNKQFDVWHCHECEVRFTQDIPEEAAIGAFYTSENYISHSDTQKGFVNKLYHRVRERTLLGKLKLIKRETGLLSGKILDIGCGTGAFLHTMNQAGWNTTGLEPSESARSKAKSLYDINALPSNEIYGLSHGNYDAITLWHVLEHVHQLHEYVIQMKNLLSEKGFLFIAVPNYRSFDAAVYKENWAAYDVPRHLYHFSPKSMKKLMAMHDLSVKKIKPMWFDSFYVSMLSEQYKNGKGNMVAAFFMGLISNIKAIFDNEKCSSVIYIIEKAGNA